MNLGSYFLKIANPISWKDLLETVLIVLPGMMLVKFSNAGWLNLFSIGVGVIGIVLAVKQGRKVLTAEQAITKLKQELHRQGGSQAFIDMIDPVNNLMSGVRVKDWKQASESSVNLSGKISNARTLYAELIDEESQTQLSNCVSTLTEMVDLLPVGQSELDDVALHELLQKCVVIHIALHGVRGKVKLMSGLE